MKKLKWQDWWLWLYAVGVCLIPPIHFHEKLFYLSELLLIPLVVMTLVKGVTGKIHRPPSQLLFIWAALLAAFLSGRFRGVIGSDLSYYILNNDSFQFSKDGVSLLRWLVIFSTPWLVQQSFKKDTKSLIFFWNSFKTCVFVSALMTLLDHFKLIDLQLMGYHQYSPDWRGRSFGTFASPLEASLIFAVTLVYLGTQSFTKKSRELVWNSVVALFCLFALSLTHGGTAIATMTLTFLFFTLRSKNRYAGRFFFLMALILGITILIVTPHGFLLSKRVNFLERFTTWSRFLKMLPHKPWLLISGIGFSGLVVDNSIILLIIKGGLLLITSVGLWLKKLYDFVPRSHFYVYVFWGLSWLTLDSLGYWGVGRLLWLTLGLIYSETSVTSLDE